MDRLLLVSRYSGEDEAGALERQHNLLAAFAAEDPQRVMAEGPDGGWVVDETVSGSINLDERKTLGQWMREPLRHNWDTMVVAEQDRVTRDDLHWWIFVGRIIEWGKRLVVLDDPLLDLSTPNGRMIAGIKATQAANYRLDVKKKIASARESFRTQARFAGGHWPFGRRAQPREGREGWELVVDPVSSAWVREAVDRVLNDDDSLREIVRDWIRRGIPTAREYQAANTPPKPGAAPKDPKSYNWEAASLVRILLSPNLLGYGTHNGEVIRKDGLPVIYHEPIITPAEALALREKLAERGEFRRGIRSNRSPLLGVAFCVAGRPMHFLRSRAGQRSDKVYQYYRCASIVKSGASCTCGQRSWPAKLVQDYLEEAFLDELGDEEIKLRKFIPGVNRQPEIDSLTDAIEHLTGNLGDLPKGSRAAKAAIEKIAEYETKLDALEAEPVVPSRQTSSGTGVTFRERWEGTPTWAERGAFLLRAKIRASFGGRPEAPEVHLRWPDDLLGTAQRAAIGGAD